VFWEGFREQLFDLREDPQELRDLGSSEGARPVRSDHKDMLFEWVRARKLSVTVPDDRICVSLHTIEPAHGIEIGVW
jgi:hypothetical protein